MPNHDPFANIGGAPKFCTDLKYAPLPITGGTAATWTDIAHGVTQEITNVLYVLAGVRTAPNTFTEHDLDALERLLLLAEANGAQVREPAAALIAWYRENTSGACVARAIGRRIPGGN